MIIASSFTVLTSFKAYGGYATVLIYHKFNEPNSPSTSVSLKTFKRQMLYLKKHGYRVISIKKLISLIKQKKRIAPKTVVITIDDGYKSTMKAYKVLKKFNYPFTVFLYAEGIGRYPAYLTKKQLRILANDPLVTIGNHSYKHLRFTKLQGKMSAEAFKRFIYRDTLRAERRIEKLTGKKPKIYAFPYGEYSRPYIKVLRKLGFVALFTQDMGNVGNFTPLYMIPREAIVGSWSSMRHFKKVLSREEINVKRTLPHFGYLKKNPTYIKFFFDTDNYKACRIYTTDHGWMRAVMRRGLVESPSPVSFKRWRNRIGLMCTDKLTNRKAVYFYMVYNAEALKR